MRKIILSLLVIVGTTAALAFGGTGAFFGDSETSTGNTFAAGAIDLKIDNHSYYNGILNASTTWELKDLTIEKFFDFPDLKPGDTGEDTISLHVNDNDAYLCANIKLTSNSDNTQTEPEALVDANGTSTGELATNVNFMWWADDGDNVLESNENVISQGHIGALGLQGSTTIALADSQNNIWTGQGGPVPGAQTHYIGKAWCFGTIGSAPLAQDGVGSSSPRTPANSNGGITCNGTALGNETQTDSLTADVTFSAVQSRNNPGFMCVPPTVRPTSKLTITKVVVNNNGGNNVVTDFHLFVEDGSVSTGVVSGVQATLPAGVYGVSETGVSGYVATFSGDCDSQGSITLNPGDEKTCTITNDDLSANITLIKQVTGLAPLADPSSFNLRVDGGLVPNTSSVAVTANTAHTINEDAKAGYTFANITGSAKCPAVLGGTATLNEGEAITCTITNAKNQ
ncbi:MAG: TasA family protein [Candidatus Taylorbacteria bacterium]|nr:TasA family protein [Candidatus Taylorbacteria bacterium]